MFRAKALGLAIISFGLLADPPAELRVLRALPQGDAGPLAVISVSFDRPIAASLEGVTADPARLIRVDPGVQGRAEWRDPVTIRFTPSRPLTPGTTYKVTVDTDFQSLDGAKLAAPSRRTRTPTASPIRTTPAPARWRVSGSMRVAARSRRIRTTMA